MVYTEQDRQRAIANLRANLELVHPWPVSWWSREDQVAALTEDWGIVVTNMTGLMRGVIRAGRMNGALTAFGGYDSKAFAFVKLRAEQGFELHQRALALHIAAVMGHLVHA